MPWTGKTMAVGLLWALLGACVICTGCSTDREFAIAEAETPLWQSVPPAAAQGALGMQGMQGMAPQDPAFNTVRTVTMQEEIPVKPPVKLPPAPPKQPAPATAPPLVTLPPDTMMPLPMAGVSDPVGAPMPRELNKISHPTYVIQPPDVLLIDAARLVPLPPYRVEPFDQLAILVVEALPEMPIKGIYQIDASGSVNLGFTYGSVNLFRQTIEEAKKTIDKYLETKLKRPYDVFVSLAETKIMQQIRGDHLVRQDGTIGLGTYGSVYVTGLTIAQAKAAIEKHLEKFLFQPKLSVDVGGFNSHMYYVIYDYPGTGQLVLRLPVTGNETVLDAISQLRFLPQGVSKRRIWVARPAPAKCGKTQVLPVDWEGITRRGQTATNYQLLPGDRVFLAPDPCSNLDAQLARLFSPIERVFGIALLGNSTILNFRSNGLGTTNGVR